MDWTKRTYIFFLLAALTLPKLSFAKKPLRTVQYSPMKEISFLIEPSFVHSISGDASILNENFDLVQLDLNLAAAYQHSHSMFRAEINYITARVTNDETKTSETFVGSALGVGYGWYWSAFRIWGVYLPQVSVVSNVDQSQLDGVGYKAAFSFPIYWRFHLVAEAKYYKFETRKTDTETTKLTGDQAITMQAYSLGISLPWMF